LEVSSASAPNWPTLSALSIHCFSPLTNGAGPGRAGPPFPGKARPFGAIP
jgi:hypothetical protein